jgi:hypothetical protein
MLRRRPAPGPPTAPAPAAIPAPVQGVAAPEGARHLVVVVLDSLRYDTWLAASTPNLDRLGALEHRWSDASWTAPSRKVFEVPLAEGLVP